MRDLLGDQSRPIFSLSKEELTEECIKRFLNSVFFFAPTVLLISKAGEEPTENEQGSFGGVRFESWSKEVRGMRGPVGGQFNGRLSCEDKWGCSYVG